MPGTRRALDHITMRRAQRIEQAAQAVVDAPRNKRTAAIDALRLILNERRPCGHQPQLDRASVIARLQAGESQASIAHDLDVTRTSIWRIAKAIGLSTRQLS